jgi:hypothetical protein
MGIGNTKNEIGFFFSETVFEFVRTLKTYVYTRRHKNSAVAMAMVYVLDGRLSISGRGKIFRFSTTSRPTFWARPGSFTTGHSFIHSFIQQWLYSPSLGSSHFYSFIILFTQTVGFLRRVFAIGTGIERPGHEADHSSP